MNSHGGLLDTLHIPPDPNTRSNPEQLRPGVMLANRYLIQEVIGVGGMGSVYRARDQHFPNAIKLVAVKEMINQARDPIIRQTIVQNFEREANILVSLNHPSIPRIYDYFTYEERSYLVLEYIHGKDLEAYLNETTGWLPEEVVLHWAIELCDVLSYLHNHKPEPIIFRDMKPSNVMVHQDNHIVLVDFGIAKIFKAGQKQTMIGTEGYSPPEQYRGDASPIADIYALGATLHHLLTRRDPRLETPFTFSERPIRKLNQTISQEFVEIIETALAYDPKDRYPTAQAMKEALLLAARKTGALARLASAPAVTGPMGESIKPLWTFACEDEVRGTPTVENGLVFVGSYDNNLYALQAGNGSLVWKYPTDGGVVSKPLVLDQAVIVGSEDYRLHGVSLRSGKVLWTYYTDGPIRSSPRAAEGHIFVGSDDRYLHAVNILSNRRAWRCEASAPIRSTPFIANDHVYYGCEDGDFYCTDFRGEIKWRFKAKRGITSSPVVTNGVVFFSGLDTHAYALDAKSGWVIWRFRMDKGSISSPSRFDNMLLVGSADGALYCLEAGNGREIWRFQTEHQVNGSPTVYKDAVYFGSVDGKVYCLELRTGRLRWKFSTDGPVTGSPVVYNGIVYIGSTDHTVYALLA